ncbi:MAG: inositol monophosphatase family protein [candidate division FCPU426 bacterium]
MSLPHQLTRIQGLLRQIVLSAGERLRRGLGKTHHIRFKSEVDLVTEMDHAVEALFVQALRRHFPGHELVSEELVEASGRGFPSSPAPRGRVRWIVDPLDGTTNYAHGFPHFAVSAGVEWDGRVRLGAVYNPMLDELFIGRLGQGAWRNGRRLKVSRTATLRHALLATGFPYDLRISTRNNFVEFQYLSQHCQAVRRAGSASLDLCDVAAGRFDGFWEYKLKPWDVAAASVMIAEAGGRLTDLAGKPHNLYGGTFLASNGRLHASLIKTLRDALAPRRGHKEA